MRKQSIIKLLLISTGLISPGISSIADNLSDFQQWKKNETGSFQEYRDKRDKEFTHFLQSQWEEIQTFQGQVRDKSPKPVHIPTAPRLPSSNLPYHPTPAKVPAVTPLAPPATKVPGIIIKHPQGEKIDLDFYGQKLTFYYDSTLAVPLPRPINEKAISQIWSSMSKADFEGLLQQLKLQRAPLNLNDWGYALLTNQLAQKIFPQSRNNQAVFTWYLMTKAGYQARIAFDSNYVYLLMPSQQPLFATPYFTFNNVRYYALSFDGVKLKPNRIFTYKGDYPGASKALDMSLNKAINTSRQQKNRTLKFKYNGQTYQIKTGHDAQTIRYLSTYPQMDIAMYFTSTVNQTTAIPVLNQLKPVLKGKSEKEAVNLLLRFVQTSFKYKTDEQQFGLENYLFPEETLHYPYSDCEDRAVFFAWLVHNLLGLEVIGLDYPGHIAAAVKFNGDVPGDSVNLNGKKFVVADPTYVNANAGMTMPAYKNTTPEIIQF
ncbi:MAG TPA: hypothetical protein ENJ08_11440 [Gammaproteobacteria bacterium]|nr:hypothetical protein [Gammaproteobacteria bacterium]